jgi:HEPN domain-containing protein
MANKQTAVEWLVKELNNLYPDLILSLKEWDDISNLITQTKQMEKQQIMDAYMDAYGNTTEPEDYYNEQYGKQ